jgi:hypothetical protein
MDAPELTTAYVIQMVGAGVGSKVVIGKTF